MNYFGEKYKSIKQKWMSKTPMAKFLVCLEIGDSSLRMIGVHVFSDNKILWQTYSILVLIILSVVLMIYTIVVSMMENNFEECLKSLCVSGLVATV